MTTVDYNEDLDILVVEKDDYTGFSRTVELGGYVLDLDEDDAFLGLEIIDATQNTPFDAAELSQISDVSVDLVSTEEYLRIEIRFTINDHRNMIASQYPALSPA